MLTILLLSFKSFFMGDSFGAGWDGSELYIFDDDGHFDYFAPNITIENQISVKYCYNAKSNMFSINTLGSQVEKTFRPSKQVTVSAAVHYFAVPSSTSVFWTARILRTGEVFTGNYLTKMVFRFYDGTVSFGYAQNLVSSKLNPAQWYVCIVS